MKGSNLAAQAGVKRNANTCLCTSNIVGFTNILEISRHNKVEHLTYAVRVVYMELIGHHEIWCNHRFNFMQQQKKQMR